MVVFVDNIYFNDNKYQTNETVRDKIYKVKFLVSYKEIYVIWNILSVNVFKYELDSGNIRLIKYMYHNFNLLKFVIRRILHIKFWLSCFMKFIICRGGTKSWNFNSLRIS